MSQLLDYAESIIEPLILGTDGSRPVSQRRFRRSINHASLRDPTYPMGAFDRAFEISWDENADWNGSQGEPNNPLDGTNVDAFWFDLIVGYVYGAGADNNANTTGSEVAGTVVLNPRKRALSDAKMLQRVLTYPGNTAGNVGAGVGMSIPQRVGSTRIEDLGGGKLLCITRYLVIMSYDPATDHSP